MVVADGPVPIWYDDTGNNHDAAGNKPYWI